MIHDIASLALSVVALVVACWVLSQTRQCRIRAEAAAVRSEAAAERAKRAAQRAAVAVDEAERSLNTMKRHVS